MTELTGSANASGDGPEQAGHVQRTERVALKTKVAFATGALDEAVMAAAGIATMLFYNQILGVSAYLCGIVFLVASIVDAVTDPLVGSLSDNFRSRWGRRHPFMLAAVIPLCLGFYLLYPPPAGMSEMANFWWFMGTLVIMRLGKTFFVVPHDALGAELSDDYHERTSIFGLNSVVGMIGASALGVLVLVGFFPESDDFENGLLNPAGYPAMAFAGATLICVVLLISIAGTRDQIDRLHKVDRQRVRLLDNLADLGALFTSKSYISICMAWLVMLVSGGILGVVGTYTFIYGFDLTTDELAIRQLVVVPGMFIAMLLAGWFTRRFDKKLTVIYTCIMCGTLVGLPHTLKLLGLFPSNESMWMLPSLFGCLFLGYLILPVVPIVIDSQLADVADEHEYRTGRRAEGLVFSIRTFALKATTGIGGLLGGFGLEIIGFPENATKEMLTPQMLNGLYFMCGPLYWMIVAAGMMFMGMYNITEKSHEDMMAELKARRASETS
jgi:Na+/melibiose symporter-like transporter